MSAADTPAPAVPLEGARLDRHMLQGCIEAAASDACSFTRDGRAQLARLAAALPGLLADAALLDRIEAELHRFADSDTAELGIARLGQRDHVFCVSMPGSTSGYEYADTLRDALREALSRALPEGGV